ncbi:MAG: lipoprotein-releasing ABC transporter ATP-binding protein LolD [Neisseriaceae bacterium]|nr:lipoprotein-releasing ABC transporter ATP-binding protein LolD [Neisseriaceae bacterium]
MNNQINNQTDNNVKEVIVCRNVGKIYRDGTLNVEVIRDLNLTVNQGESVSIVGASGSGKSTLLHLLGGLDNVSNGNISLMGQDFSTLNQKQLGQLRNKYLGFVYQFHHLLPEFSAKENVMMPLLIAKYDRAIAENLAVEMLEKVGLKQRIEHRPQELSGGERQRTAIARALVTRPACILADEPTGSLDKKNANSVLSMMLELKKELNTALVVVTHDDDLIHNFDRVLKMDDGKLLTKID